MLFFIVVNSIDLEFYRYTNLKEDFMNNEEKRASLEVQLQWIRQRDALLEQIDRK